MRDGGGLSDELGKFMEDPSFELIKHDERITKCRILDSKLRQVMFGIYEAREKKFQKTSEL